MKKVAFVINSMEGGGAERAMCRLLQELDNDRWAKENKVHLILLDDETIVQSIPDYVQLHVLNSRGRFFSSIVGLYKTLKRIRPDVVVSYLTRANVASVISAKMLGTPSIISERVNTSSHFSGVSGAVNKGIVSFVYPMATRVVAVSQGVKEDLVSNYRVDRAKCSVIYNGYNAEHLNEASQLEDVRFKRPYAIAVGRLVKNKNFRLLLEAFYRAKTDYDLIILGEGDLHSELEEFAKDLGLLDSGRIIFQGFKENPYPLMANAIFYVSSSNAEGFPNSLVEAMTLGLPVISTDCPSGPQEILAKSKITVASMTDSDWGVLVPVGDLESMVQALEYFSTDSNRSKYSRLARERAVNFSIHSIKSSYISMIDEVAK